MAKRDLVKTLRDLIVMEVRREQPSFSILRNLQSTLQDAMKRENRLSVDDADTRFKTMSSGIVVRGNNIYADDEDEEGQMGQRQGGRTRRRESERDQMLSALDQMVARTGADPLVPVIQAVPYLDAIYPEDDRREATLARIRREIEERLPAQPPHAIEDREEQAS